MMPYFHAFSALIISIILTVFFITSPVCATTDNTLSLISSSESTGYPYGLSDQENLTPNETSFIGTQSTHPDLLQERDNIYSYPIIETGQDSCYDTKNPIPAPNPKEPFFGQDAQHTGTVSKYHISADGLLVTDDATHLTWQQSPDSNSDGTVTPDDKLTWPEAQVYPATLNARTYGGYSDWRLPTIKELYSLIRFSGTDPSGPEQTDPIPFIDTGFFTFVYGDKAFGERIIDSQYASKTVYKSGGVNGGEKIFGVNFADGRIKGYDRYGPEGREKTFYVICVRGNPEYGINDFSDNEDGTITDHATGRMWSEADSGLGLNWEEALAWVADANAKQYLGYSDWRLPDAKEMQSIADYTRSPDYTGSAAIDPLFSCTAITNEAGELDYPWYWTGTTHVSSDGTGGNAVYIAFGRALGFLNGHWQDVHGAGAQRSDPKTGSGSMYPHGHGPQGDAIRIENFVRLVRDIVPPSSDPGIEPATRIPSVPAPVRDTGFQPFITNIYPESAMGGTRMRFTLYGENFSDPAGVQLDHNGRVIPAEEVVVQNAESITGSFSLPAVQDTTVWTVVVRHGNKISNNDITMKIIPGPKPVNQPVMRTASRPELVHPGIPVPPSRSS